LPNQVEVAVLAPAAVRENLPEVGSMLPDITLYDDGGKEFSTTNLRGLPCLCSAA